MSRYIVSVRPEAEDKFHDILDWLEERFGFGLSNQVNQKFEELLTLLSTLPYAWPQERLRSGIVVRKAQINQMTLVFYIVNDEKKEVQVVDITDARTDWK